MEAAFVKSTVGDVLVRAMAEVAKYRPEDPIQHLSTLLHKECDARERQQHRQEEMERYLQQQKKKQEEEEKARKHAEEEEQQRRQLEEARAQAAAVQRPAPPMEDAGAARAYAQLTSDFPSTITHFAGCPLCSADHATAAATGLAQAPAELELLLSEDADRDDVGATLATATPEEQETYAALTRQHPSTIAMFAGVPLGGVTTDEAEADGPNQPAAETDFEATAEGQQASADEHGGGTAAEEENKLSATEAADADTGQSDTSGPGEQEGQEEQEEEGEKKGQKEGKDETKTAGKEAQKEEAAPDKAVNDEEDEGHIEEVEPTKLDLEQPGEEQPAGEGETTA